MKVGTFTVLVWIPLAVCVLGTFAFQPDWVWKSVAGASWVGLGAHLTASVGTTWACSGGRGRELDRGERWLFLGMLASLVLIDGVLGLAPSAGTTSYADLRAAVAVLVLGMDGAFVVRLRRDAAETRLLGAIEAIRADLGTLTLAADRARLKGLEERRARVRGTVRVADYLTYRLSRHEVIAWVASLESGPALVANLPLDAPPAKLADAAWEGLRHVFGEAEAMRLLTLRLDAPEDQAVLPRLQG